MIQTKSINQTGGIDISSNQFDFSGKILRTHLRHNNVSGGSTQTVDVATKYSYDVLGRQIGIEKDVNNSGNWRPTSAMAYDALGQLKKKELGTNLSTSQPLEELNYDYNIRGWLLGINKASMLVSNGPSERKFGFELGYNRSSNTTQP